MTDREIAEIRRRFKRERSGISRIRGCFVNENKEIISETDQSLGLMSETECDHVLALLKKTLSGGMGINLLDIDFSTTQVSAGEEHGLLMKLRDSQLSDEEAVKALYRKIIDSLVLEGSYMILLAADTYDVFSFTKDGKKSEDAAEVFRYVICAVCPIQTTKPALSYQVKENCFKNVMADAVVSPPQVGFMFPAFDNRATNLYGALYYTKSKDNNHDELAQALFKTQRLPMPAKEQTETFKGWDKGLIEKGIRTLTYNYYDGARSFMGNAKFETPADLKGVVCRTPGAAPYVESITALGATPYNIAWSEVYNGIQTKAIDACEVQYTSAVSSAMYEVCQYVSKTEHINLFNMVICGEKWFSKLPAEYQTILLEEFFNAGYNNAQEIIAAQDTMEATLVEKGMEIVEVDKAIFMEAAEAAYAKLGWTELRAQLYTEAGLN